MPSDEKPLVEALVSECRLSGTELKDALKAFLRKYGDELPEDVINGAVSDKLLDKWVYYCAPDNPKEVIAGFHYENNDWYLCTLKNAAVRTEDRRKGIGEKLYEETADKAKKDPGWHVLAADVTSDNAASIKLFERMGFKKTNRFCWAPNEKPADILHFVNFPADGNECK